MHPTSLLSTPSAKRKPPVSFDGLLCRLADIAPMFIGEVRDHVHALEHDQPARRRGILDG